MLCDVRVIAFPRSEYYLLHLLHGGTSLYTFGIGFVPRKLLVAAGRLAAVFYISCGSVLLPLSPSHDQETNDDDQPIQVVCYHPVMSVHV